MPSATRRSPRGCGLDPGRQGLRKLDLSETEANDDALRHVAGFAGLQWLNLWHTRVTDAGLRHLAALRSLKYLNLTDTAIGNAGLEQLGKIAGLETLNLDLTRTSDAGLMHLAGLSKLRSLGLDRTKVSAEGMERLRQACRSAKSSKFAQPPLLTELEQCLGLRFGEEVDRAKPTGQHQHVAIGVEHFGPPVGPLDGHVETTVP